MIWVDTKNEAEFDHLNAVYHAYKEAGGTALNQSEFADVFANLTNTSGFSIGFRNSFEELGEPTKGKQNILWLVPASQTEVNNLYDEYIVVKLNDTMLDTYVWEKWGNGTITVDLSNYYTKAEVNTIKQELEELIEDASSMMWNDVTN